MSDYRHTSKNTDINYWIRTGRFCAPVGHHDIETKFNPWHNPDNGQFTFRHMGRYFGGAGASGAWQEQFRSARGTEHQPKNSTPESRRDARIIPPAPALSPVMPPSARTETHEPPSAPPTSAPPQPVAPKLVTHLRATYRFHVDAGGRTRLVEGQLHLKEPSAPRSRRAQSAAGGRPPASSR